MKLSLVTPCYNSAAYLEETIQSVLSQNVPYLEYVIIDGGSKDGTVEIIRRYEDRLAFWLSEPDRGQTDALNKGFPRLTGDIVAFINADDVFVPGALTRVLAAFEKSPETDIVYGGVEWIDAQSKKTGEHLGDISSLEEVLNIYDVWWGKRQWVQPEVFWRRALKEKVGAFDESYHLAFDFEYWVRCFRAGARVQRIPDPVVQFRLHAQQKSTAAAKAADEIRAIVRRHLDDGAAISDEARRRLEARLSYDLYQLRPEPKPGFLKSLASHPQWLFVPEVQSRLRAACGRFLGSAKTTA